jgi:hypothetical protein
MALDQAARLGHGFGAGQADVVVIAIGRAWLSGVRRRVPDAVTVGRFDVQTLASPQADRSAEALKALDPVVAGVGGAPASFADAGGSLGWTL